MFRLVSVDELGNQSRGSFDTVEELRAALQRRQNHLPKPVNTYVVCCINWQSDYRAAEGFLREAS